MTNHVYKYKHMYINTGMYVNTNLQILLTFSNIFKPSFNPCLKYLVISIKMNDFSK